MYPQRISKINPNIDRQPHIMSDLSYSDRSCSDKRSCDVSCDAPCKNKHRRPYDDQCCDLVKDAYAVWDHKVSKYQCIVMECLTKKLNKCEIGNREYSIRYALFQQTLVQLEDLFACALKKITHRDYRADANASFNALGYTYGCFNNDYCERAVKSVLCTAISRLREAAHITLNLDLDRSTQECSSRILVTRTKRAFGVAISTEGCAGGACGVPAPVPVCNTCPRKY